MLGGLGLVKEQNERRDPRPEAFAFSASHVQTRDADRHVRDRPRKERPLGSTTLIPHCSAWSNVVLRRCLLALQIPTSVLA